MDFANRHGMRVCAHAKGALGVDAAIRHGLASVEHALQASDANLSLMEERNVFIALTLEGFECRYRHAKEHHERTDIVLNAEREWNLAQNLARRLANFHGESLSANNVLFGSDAGSHSTPHASLRELALMRRMGFSATDIFRSATWNGARFLNQSHVMGKIDGGYAADFIVWQKNPLEFSNAEWENLESHMVAVVVGGVVVGTDFSV
jgi:imidazolonepropionase-like amidohydrolase